MKKAWLLAGAALVGGILGNSNSAWAEKLEDALASAYNSNPTLLARRAQLRSSDEAVPKALSNWRPTVKVTNTLTSGRYETNTQEGRVQHRTPRSMGLSVSQPIYRGGRTVAETEQAEASVMAERASLVDTEQTVLLNATSAYLNVVRDEAVLRLSINNEQVLRRQLEAAQERFRVGEITRTDVSQAEARLARSTADRIAAEGTTQGSRANFVNVVGRVPEAPQPSTSAPEIPTSLDDLKAAALAANPKITAADFTAKAAKDGVDLVAGELLPTVSLSGDLSRGQDTSSRYSETGGTARNKYESVSAEAALSISVPLYEGGGTYARLRGQKHTLGQRLILADQARRDAIEAATRAWEDLQAAKARVRSYTAQIRASELALAGVEEEAKVGSRTVLDVLDAEQELFDARVNLVRAQHDETLAAYQVRSAMGSMTAKALALPVDLYDPVKHYDDVRDKWIGGGIEKSPGYED